MIFQEMLKDEREAGKMEGKAEGKAEAVLEILQEIGMVPDEIKGYIMAENDMERLKEWIKLAARSVSVEEFVSKMNE